MRTRHLFQSVPYILLVFFLVIAGVLAFVIATGGVAAAQEEARTAEDRAAPEWQKGTTIRFSGSDTGASEAFRSALQEWADLGGNTVTLALPWMQQDLNASEVYPHRGAPSEQALAQGIQLAHELGLSVNLLPHVDTEDYQWRARIRPDDPDAWFQSYGEMLVSHAQIAEANGVGMVTIATELVALTESENTERWRDLIGQVREVYSGELTYSANWGGTDARREAERIEFWDDLDYIGIAAYYPFNPPYTVTSVREQWDSWEQDRIGPLQEDWDMPVLFTEVGYRSVEGALNRPWDWDMTGSQDEEAQATGYEALFAFWSEVDYFRGVHFWDWRIGARESFWESESWALGYTPQRKAAQDVLREQFGEIGEEEAASS